MAERQPPDLSPVELLLRIQPQATWVGDRLEVQYAATLQPANAPEPERPDPVAPWGHDLTSASVTAAAEAVRLAAPGERHAALLALIDRITGQPDG